MYPANWAITQPDAPAVVIAETGDQTTYAELDRESNRVAQYLRSVGCDIGDHLALFMGNTAEVFPVAWAAQRAGLYYTPINWHLTPEETAYVVADSGAKVLIADAEHAGMAADLVGQGSLIVAVHGEDVPGCQRLEEVLESMPDHPVADETEGADMIYTSGTTGTPKGGVRPLPGLRPGDDNPKLVALPARFGFDHTSVYLSPGAPLYHGAPLRFSMATHRFGGTAVVMQRFDSLEALRAIEAHGVTHSQWVPAMFVRLLRLSEADRSRFDLSSHRVAIHAAAPCPPSVKRDMLAWWGPIIHEYYGASEGGIFTHITPEEWLQHPGSVGRPIIGRPHIVGNDGHELPRGEVGLIYSERGAPVAYHNDAEKTAAAHAANGWSTVGDLGHLDDDGYLYLSSRRTDLIISGGVNIYPKESEDVLSGHPAVADVAVIAVPHDEYGQEVKAVVELHDPDGATDELAAELIHYCREHLAAYKCPRSVDFDRQLPRVSSGKLYKQRLLERYWAGVAH
ncbi:MAG TPA: AMP-binding protein [Acidimicrobiales bacterium]|jgi:fatty-acyl-CoA synthase|nr:AMP-binding protein [Acidimicrobiales bacterium]